MRAGIDLVLVMVLLGASIMVFGQNGTEVQQKPPAGSKFSDKPQVSPADIEKWIEQLGNAEFQVRQEALRKLREAGLEAIPILEQALTKYTDPNIRRHIKELLTSYNAAPQLLPTRITLKLREVSLQETLQALAKATGYRFELAPFGDSADSRVVFTWDWQNATFWEVLQELCNCAGISYMEGWYSQDGKTIRLEPGESHPSYSSLSGPFRVTVVGFSYNRNVSFMTGPKRWNPNSTVQRHEALSVNLRVTVEPRYAFVAVNGVTIEEAEDDRGVSRVLPRQNDNSQFAHYYYGGGRMYQQQISAALLPNDVGGTLKKFRGSISALAIAGERPVLTVENAHLSKGKRLEKDNVALTIQDIKDDGSLVHVKLEIWRRADGQRRDPNWVHTVPQRVKVYDAKGNELRPAGTMTWTTNQDNASGTLAFQREQVVAAGPAIGIGRVLGGKPKPEEALRLVYCEWDVVHVHIPFSFKDVPLP